MFAGEAARVQRRAARGWFDEARRTTDPELTPAEQRDRDMRTSMLKEFDPKNPEKMLIKLLQHITDAVEQREEKAEVGFRGIEAILEDDVLRNRLFDAWKDKKESGIKQHDVEWVLNRYRIFLRHHEAWPKMLAARLFPQELRGLYIDLLANKHFFLDEEVGVQEDLKIARRGLRDIYSSEPLSGKQTEWGLIGLLRYGPGVYAGTFSNTPKIYIAHTLPKQDLYGASETKKADIVWRLPGYQIVDFYGLKSTSETHVGELNVIGPEVRWCWERIANPDHDMSPMEWNEWKIRYRALIEDLAKEMIQSTGAKADKVSEFQSLLLPRVKRRQVEMIAQPDLDGAFTLEKMREKWPVVLKSFPDLGNVVGLEVTVENFNAAKLAFERLYAKQPDLRLWQGWIKMKRRKAS